MKISNFKKTTKEHIETCEQIIKLDGWCEDGNNYEFCRKCPFHSSNAINHKSCFENGYKKLWTFPQSDILKAANQFIKLIKIRENYKEKIKELQEKLLILELDK